LLNWRKHSRRSGLPARQTRGADRYRECLREQGIGLHLPHAGEFLRIPSISKPITYEPELTEDDLGLFEVRCRQGSERDAGRRRADAPRAAMKHRLMRSLRSATQRQSCLLDNRRGARSLVSSKHVRQSARHANSGKSDRRINSYLIVKFARTAISSLSLRCCTRRKRTCAIGEFIPVSS